VRFHHVERDSVLLCPEKLVEGKLVVDDLVGLLSGVPAPRACLPVKDMVLSVWSLHHEVDEALELHVFALDVLVKLFFGCDDFALLKVVIEFVTEGVDNGLVLSHHLLL